jgi:hypothetical protein
MTYDPNVFGYVDGQPTYSRDDFIYKKRRRGPITDDAELVAFAEKVTSGWYNAGWHQTFTTYYLGDYALSEPLDSMYQQIPRGGYICPHCESRLRAGETLPNQRPGQNDRPQTTKGAKP